MRTILFVTLLPFCLSSGNARAAGPVKFSKGVVRLVDGAAEVKNRSLWVRGQSLVLVLPGEAIQPQTIKTEDSIIREIRFSGRSNRTELELRLAERAEKMLPRMTIKQQNQDLLISFAPPPASDPSPSGLAKKNSTASANGLRSGKQTQKNRQQVSAGGDGSKKNVTERGQGFSGTTGSWSTSDRLRSLNLKSSSAGTSSLWLLMLAISTAGGVAWWLRRRGKGPALNNVQIEIVSSRSLSAKQRLVLVEASGELLLLGCSEKEIRLLRAVDRGKLQEHQERQEKEFFAEGQRIDDENTRENQSVDQNQNSSQHQAGMDEPARSSNGVLKSLLPSVASHKAPETSSARSHGARVEDRCAPPAPQPLSVPKAIQDNSSGKEKPLLPLDEHWAEGILKLRRAYRNKKPSSTETLH